MLTYALPAVLALERSHPKERIAPSLLVHPIPTIPAQHVLPTFGPLEMEIAWPTRSALETKLAVLHASLVPPALPPVSATPVPLDPLPPMTPLTAPCAETKRLDALVLQALPAQRVQQALGVPTTLRLALLCQPVVLDTPSVTRLPR
jgi:hypothetical protein